MIYIIEGEEEFFIKKKIKELTNIDNSEIVTFDGNDKNFTINELINTCNSNSLFSDKTIVLVKDPFFLIKKTDDSELKELFEYIDNPIYETDLIFYTLENKLNSKLKSYKYISKNANLISCEQLDNYNFNIFAKQEINKGKLKINNDAINLLIQICKRDASLFIRNFEILENYPSLITVDVVQKLCTYSNDNDAFEIINAITNKNISKAINIERKMLSENSSIMSIIGLLASQLRFLYQLSYYRTIGKNKKEIMEITKCSEGRYIKSLETLNHLDQKEILLLLDKLSTLDIECKTNNTIDELNRFELFIINIMKENSYARN